MEDLPGAASNSPCRDGRLVLGQGCWCCVCSPFCPRLRSLAHTQWSSISSREIMTYQSPVLGSKSLKSSWAQFLTRLPIGSAIGEVKTTLAPGKLGMRSEGAASQPCALFLYNPLLSTSRCLPAWYPSAWHLHLLALLVPPLT